MNRQMVVFTDGGGRFGNQLLNFGHLIAWVQEYRSSLQLVDVAFWPYSHLCSGIASNWYCTYPSMQNHLVRSMTVRNLLAPDKGYTWHRITRLLRTVAHTLNPTCTIKLNWNTEPNLTENLVDHIKNCKSTVVLHGYGPRNWDLLRKHEGLVRSLLSPNMQLIPESYALMERLKHRNELLIGIHIRQDDYIQWQNGRYFFSLEKYRDVMHQLQSIYAPRQVRFHITSRRIDDKSVFVDFNASYANSLERGTHFIGDMYELSQCDLIVGPPSTFSTWAAFIGHVPILPITDLQENVDIKDILLYDHLFDAWQHKHFSRAVH